MGKSPMNGTIPVWELISEVGARCGPLPPGCAYLIRF